MPLRNFNLLSATQRSFGTDAGSDLGGWALRSGAATVGRLLDAGAYNTYIPGDEFSDVYVNNLLFVRPTSASADVVIESPFLTVTPGNVYLVSMAIGSLLPKTATIRMEFYGTASTPAASAVAGNAVASAAITTANTIILPFQRIYNSNETLSGDVWSLSTESLAKVTITFESPAASGDFFTIFDPFVTEDDLALSGNLSGLAYSDMPNFMQVDDKNINDLLGARGAQALSFPLKRFTESLYRPVDLVAAEALEFEYVRPIAGTESKSKLTDPDTAASGYLPWLASVTGTTLLTISGGGISPWAALEQNDEDESGNPGEWADIEAVGNWQALEQVGNEFFDNIKVFRDLIRTGFTGINSGRPDTIASFLQTVVGAAEFTPVIKNNDRDNPFLVEVLVDPATDLGGTFIKDYTDFGLSAGANSSTTGSVVDSGRGSLDFSKLVYPATHSDAAATGAVTYGKSFVSDADGFARHLRLVPGATGAASAVPELGGGIADAHYTTGAAYVYGNTGPTSYGSVTAAVTAVPFGGSGNTLSLGGVQTEYELIFVLSDITVPTASIDAAGSGGNTPADWLYREKRLLACGTDSGGNGNDWAVYLVSGSTSDADNQTRLMLIDGYNNVGATNYAVSDPIDFGVISSRGDVVLRVKRSAVESASATATFYAQSSIYDDWDTHQVGEVVFQPTSAAVAAPDTNGAIQILGELNSNDNWADAVPVSCSVKRFMFFKELISFAGGSATSSAAHAYFNGGSTTNFGVYSYTPTLDIDFSGRGIYDSSFTLSDYVDGRRSGLTNTVTVTVNEAPTNGLDVLAFRDTGTDYWYYGTAAPSIAGDTLTIDGLSNSTAYRVVPTIVNTGTGATSTSDFTEFTTDGSGVLTLSASAAYDGVSALYGGITASAIEVQPSGGGTAVARFLPTTIAASATSGADSITGTNTWTLTRTFPASSIAYAPSQIINRDFLHVYEGGPTFNNCPEIEVYSDFSVLLQCRRFWTASTGTEFDILRIETNEVTPKGLRIFYDGPAIKATFYDGTNTETVSWTESPAYGSWQWFVVRRDPTNGLSLVPPGSYSPSNLVSGSEITASATATSLFSSPTSVMKLGEDDGASTWNARFGLSEFVYFDRKLTDAEIELLSTQIS